MRDSALDLAIKNWHASEMRAAGLEIALKNVLRMPSVPQQAKAIIREAITSLVVTPQVLPSAEDEG